MRTQFRERAEITRVARDSAARALFENAVSENEPVKPFPWSSPLLLRCVVIYGRAMGACLTNFSNEGGAADGTSTRRKAVSSRPTLSSPRFTQLAVSIRPVFFSFDDIFLSLSLVAPLFPALSSRARPRTKHVYVLSESERQRGDR